jgi:hypothetical protein
VCFFCSTQPRPRLFPVTKHRNYSQLTREEQATTEAAANARI